MVVLALVLLVVAGVFAAAVLIEATDSVSPEVWGVSTDTTARGIFAAGAVTMLVFLIGLWLLKRSLARARRLRGEVKSLKRGRNEDVARLQDEKAQLEAALRRDNQPAERTEVVHERVTRDVEPARGDTTAPHGSAGDGHGATAQGVADGARRADLTDLPDRESRR